MTPSESDAAWQPPSTGSAVPRPPMPPAGPSMPPAASSMPGPPIAEMTFGSESPADAPRRRSRRAMGGVAAGVLALGAAGVFAATQLGGDATAGGADSPEQVGIEMMAALEQQDVLAMLDLMLPGERDTLRQPTIDVVSELARLELLSSDVSLADLGGLDIDLSREAVSVEPTNVADVANITMTADATATVAGADLPVGDLVGDVARRITGEEMDLSSIDDSGRSDLDVSMAAVEEDGRWYLSVGYSIAEAARAGADELIPAEPIVVRGGDSPEGAIDVLLDGVEQLDLSVLLGAINPDEASALHRYAPLFLDEAQAVLDDIPLRWQVTGVEYSVDGDGSKRFVTIDSLRIDGDAEGSEFSFEVRDGCVVVEAEDERIDSCATATDSVDLEDVVGDAGPIRDLADEVAAAFADYAAPGITVHEVDGQWFVSPVAAGFDQLLAVLRALDRSEIDGIVDQVEATVNAVADDLGGVFVDILGGDVLNGDVLNGDILNGDTSLPFDTDDPTAPQSDDVDWFEAESACLTLPLPQVRECFLEQIAAGTLPEGSLPVEIEFLECGLGEIRTGEVLVFDLSDEAYTDLVTTSAACFGELIERGVVDEFLVPPEFLRPQCAQGQNPWNDDGDLFDTWLDCIYS